METNTNLPPNEGKPLEAWAFIEIMGHSKIAGLVTERKLGTNVMIQVDVPKGDNEFAYSRLFNPGALFSITPTSEEWCRKWATAAADYDRSPLPYLPDVKALPVEDDQPSEDHYVDDVSNSKERDAGETLL